MTYIHRMWLILIQHKQYSLSLFLLVFLFSLLGIVSNFFVNIVDNYQHLVVSDTGYSLMLYTPDDRDIPQDLLQRISDIDGVIGLNQESNMLVQPVNFTNAIMDNSTDVFDVPTTELVKLFADTDTTLNQIFTNNMRLIEGDMPSNNAGVLIDTVLAYKNNLKIGNFITIQNPATGKELSLCIVGIYESLSFPQEAWKDGSDSMVYGQSPYSYIFCDIHSYEKLIDGSLSSSSIKIYTKNAKYLDSVNDTLSQMNLLPSEYRLVNFTESKLNMGISSYRAIASSAILLSTVSISVAAFVLSLVVVLWMRTCYKDISILITLGANRCKIILDYFLIISIISFLSLVLSLPFCVFIITSFGSSLIEYTYIAAGNLSNGGINNYMVGALNQHLEIVDYLKSQCIFLVIVWLSTLLASINILKNKPSKLFYQ